MPPKKGPQKTRSRVQKDRIKLAPSRSNSAKKPGASRLEKALAEKSAQLHRTTRQLEIEAALEKVRVRTMAMRVSAELSEASVVLFQQLKKLRIHAARTSVGIFDDAHGAIELWTTFSNKKKEIKILDYVNLHIHPVFENTIQPRRDNEPFALTVLTRMQARQFYEMMSTHVPLPTDQPDNAKEFFYSFFFPAGILNVTCTQSLTQEECQIMVRFAGVFGLIYTRFLDLQKAEDQTREAKIEAALERVRTVAMSMRKSSDLLLVCESVFKELRLLGFTELDLRNAQIVINNDEKGIYYGYQYSDYIGAEFSEVPYDIHPVIRHLNDKLRQSKDAFADIEISGAELKDWKGFVNSFPQKRDKKLNKATELHYYFYSVGIGALGVSSFEPLLGEHLKILQRLRNVFDLCYQRYSDITQAEAQAREAKIEAALERIRARAMAMHTSNELMEVADVLREQMGLLGQPELETAALHLYNEDPDHIISWRAFRLGTESTGEISKGRMAIPKDSCQIVREWIAKFQSGAAEYTIEVSGARQKAWYKVLFSLAPDVRDAMLKKKSTTESRYYHFSTFSGGALLMVAIKKPSGESIYLQRRAAGVFDLAYRRFLDLKRVEAQATEARIELSLERVRARAMAMHKSEELGEVAEVLYEELKKLGLTNFINCGYVIVDEANHLQYGWMTNIAGRSMEKFNLPLVGDSVLRNRYEAWKRKEPIFVQSMGGKGLKKHIEVVNPKLGSHEVDQHVRNNFPDPTIFYCGNFSHGYLSVITGALLNEEETSLLPRFSRVFELTYKRFLDLQNAEAQATEARIETALEKIRSRSLAMHKSDELRDVITIVVERLDELGIGLDSAGINIPTKDRSSYISWVASKSYKYPQGLMIPWSLDSRIQKDLTQAYESEMDYFSKLYSLEEKNEYLNNLFVGSDFSQLPDDRKSFLLSQPCYAISSACTKNSWIQTISYSGKLLSNDEGDVLKRFARVFEQAYTRFLDLQKAEAQSTESQIQLALERARTQSMIMQHSKELDDTLRVFHEQVLLLGIKSAFSFLWLPDEEKDRHIFWAVWEESKSDTTTFKSKAIDYPLDRNEPATAQCLVDWKSDEPVHSYAVLPAEVENYFAAWSELFTGTEQLKPEYFTNGLHYVEAFMKYGCFGVMVESGLPEDEKKILERFSIEFERAYTRFLDLQKAEAQAREAKIEAALEKVRSRSLAMHKAEELIEVASVLRTEMGLLGVEELETSSIYILNEENANTECWYAIKDIRENNGKLVTEHITLNLNETWVGRAMLSFYRSGEKQASILMQGENRKEWINYCATKSNLLQGYYGGKIPERTYHLLKFSNGYMGAASPGAISAESWNLLQRVTAVFSFAYTRFLDLQKAETQAREAEIQLALERVRAKTMAMHNSSDVGDTVATMYEEVKRLGFDSFRFGIAIFHEDGILDAWTVRRNEKGDPILLIGKLGTHIHPMLQASQKAWTTKQATFSFELQGQELTAYYSAVNSYPDYPIRLDLEKLPQRQFFSMFLFTEGALFAFTSDPIPSETSEIMQRFANSFGQTHRRYLDLVKAEALAREAKIEAALERVRSRSIGMQKSDELRNVIQLVFEQLLHLDFKIDSASFDLNYNESDDFNIWTANPDHSYPDLIHIPYFDNLVFNSLKNAKAKGINFFTDNFSFEEKNKFWHHFFSHYKIVPEERRKYILNSPGFARSLVFMNTISLFILNYQGIPYSDSENEVLKRFARVFEQSYTRFLDLQKAEAQAEEARIENALEKVRSRSLAMHKSDELQVVVNAVLERMHELGIDADSANIVSLTHNTRDMDVWVANAPHTYLTRVFVPHFDHPISNEAFDARDIGKDIFSKTYSFEEKNQWFTHAFAHTEFRHTPEERKKFILSSDAFTLSMAFAKNAAIWLSRFSKKVFSEKENDILKRFARVFDQAYTRFLDLQNAEAQAREAQIEAALERTRTQSMIMQHSNELDDALRVFHEQVLLLGINSEFSYLWLPDEEKDNHLFWATWAEHQNGSSIFKSKALTYDLERTEPYTAVCIAAWKSDVPVHSYTLLPAEVKNYFAAWKELLDGVENLKPELFPEGLYYVEAFMKYGCFGVMIKNELSDEEKKILGRFSIEFERTYTRFLDLKKAEAQAREAEIQLAMERVRARTMAMQKSDELPEAANLLFQQVQSLGMPAWSAGYCTWDDDKKAITLWMSSENVLQPSFKLPLTEDPSCINFLKAHQRGEPFYVEEIGGEELVKHYAYMQSLPMVGKVLQSIIDAGHPLPTFQIFHCAYFSKGFLLFITYESVPEAHEVFKRFAKVFEQTYTRFLDLQKAEAQAREATIEASLERVRSKTMAMHNSQDVGDTIAVLFDELLKLGIKTDRSGILIMQENNYSEAWAARSDADGKVDLIIGGLDMTIHGLTKGYYEAWRNKQPSFEYKMEGEDILAYYTAINRSKDYPGQFDIGSLPKIQYSTGFYFPEGYIFAFTQKSVPPDQAQIFIRFAGVFGQTYRRYLDLVKAETQAHEAVIEAALERVRGKAMAMHNSNDLIATAGLVFIELKKLGINSFRSGVGLLTTENRKVKLYSAMSGDEGSSLALVGWAVLDDHPVLSETYNRWIRDEDYFPTLKGDLLKTYYEKVIATFTVPTTQSEGYEQFGYFLPFSEGVFYGWSEKLYTEAQIKILNRFKAIIDLTFRRYIELQKSEANALEAVRQASLDRVRAEIASMRTTQDLERITPLIWQELTTLGVPFIRCGVFIMNEHEQQIQTFLSTPDGKAIAALHVPFDTDIATFSQGLAYWRRKEIYTAYWDAATFSREWDKIEKMGALESEPRPNQEPPAHLHLHFIPFLQGMLYAGNISPLGENDMNLLQSVAEAFSTAYARYEDFNKLEHAKKQVEKTLSDLKLAQTQLVQSEKMASLGELTAGIAHEIQNPLNFVNNFSEVSKELLDEMKAELDKGNSKDALQLAKDVIENLEKITHHGKRADGIVKGMLQHSRASTGQKELTDINVLADEYLRLAFHGLRAKDKSFNAKFETDFDASLTKINIVPQDIGRVILNLITNAFYVVNEKRKAQLDGYEPMVSVGTKMKGNKVLISVKDNGKGMSAAVKEKIFQPFFTTKPTGQGTGLGLSLSYDIVKAHGGEIKVETKEGEGSRFIIVLP